MSGDMDSGTPTSVSEVQAAFAEQFEAFEEDLIDIGYLAVTTVFDLPMLIEFATATRHATEDEEDDEYDYTEFYETVFTLAGEMLLEAKRQGWGGEALQELYDYFELNG